nr:hypothetical protein Iba_chr14bCG11050 [Ipomoea batatas]
MVLYYCSVLSENENNPSIKANPFQTPVSVQQSQFSQPCVVGVFENTLNSPLSIITQTKIVVYIVRFRTSVPASDVCFGSSKPLKTNGSTIKSQALELNRCLDMKFAEAAQTHDQVSHKEDGNTHQM